MHPAVSRAERRRRREGGEERESAVQWIQSAWQRSKGWEVNEGESRSEIAKTSLYGDEANH